MKTKQTSPLILITKIAVYISFVMTVIYMFFNVYQIVSFYRQGFAPIINENINHAIIFSLFNVTELFFLVLIFWRLRPDELFVPKNILYIKIIGVFTIIGGFTRGILTALPQHLDSSQYFLLFMLGQFGWNSIVTGLLILVIAVSFERAYLIQEEQSLTV